MPHRVSPRGLTLIELAVAIVVLSVGTLAAFRAIDQSQRGIGGQVPRALAHEVAMTRADELRLLGMQDGRALPREVEMGPFRWTVEVGEQVTAIGLIEAEIRVRAPGQPGARLAVYVPVEAEP